MTPTREELATIQEIAQMLNVPVKVVWNWQDRRNRNNFPAPVAQLAKPRHGKGYLWIKTEVIEWHEGYDSSYWRYTRSDPKPAIDKEAFTMLEVSHDKAVRSHSHAQW